MNTPGGYGVFSITPPPAHFVRSGALTLAPGATVLLASDGLTRLVDVFGRYDARKLFDRARSHGLATLIGELRQIETVEFRVYLLPACENFRRCHRPAAACCRAVTIRGYLRIPPYACKCKVQNGDISHNDPLRSRPRGYFSIIGSNRCE